MWTSHILDEKGKKTSIKVLKPCSSTRAVKHYAREKQGGFFSIRPEPAGSEER
jgi:hypothetical protein